MHATNSDLSQRNGLVSSVHGCRNVFFGRTERFGKVCTQIDLQFRQPVLVVVQTQRHTTREPLLVVITHDCFRQLDFFVARLLLVVGILFATARLGSLLLVGR